MHCFSVLEGLAWRLSRPELLEVEMQLVVVSRGVQRQVLALQLVHRS